MERNPYLHEEIRDILYSNGNSWMTTGELAILVNRRGRYKKRDGSPVTAFQIHGRTRKRPELFERDGSRIRCRNPVELADDYPRALGNLGFKGFLTVADLRCGNRTEVPAEQGVYLVLRDCASYPEFVEEGSGGKFKGEDPNVSIAELAGNWVEGAFVVYIGQSGSNGKGTLNGRIGELIRFGQGAPVGHRGGRFIWQLAQADELLVCWKETAYVDPRQLKKDLIENFKSAYGGRRPFANLRG